MATISRCVHCGELAKLNIKYCKNCKTADGRRQVDAENEEIKEENLAEGYNYNES